MTQSNSIDYNDTISGTQLANFLNDDYEALLTNHKGPSRPSYIVEGQFWIDDSSTPWAFNIYDGSNDITLFNIDPSGDSYTLTDFDFSSLAGDGLKEGTNTLDIEPADFAGAGLQDDGADNLEFAVTYSSDGTTTITGPTDVNYGSEFTVTDDGDGTVTIDLDTTANVALDLGNDGTDESTDIARISTDNDRNSALTEANADEFLIEPYKIGAPEGYLQHDGLTISNNSTDADHDIDVNGGAVGVHDFNGNWRVVELADETPAFQIDGASGDNALINGSTLTADTWYELAVIADSSGSNSPSVVGYTDGNRPTASGDLPTGYDLFRAMGTPGKTWWIKTDGSSNIHEFRHNSEGDIIWETQTLNTFNNLLNETTAVTSWTSIGVSSQLPPTPVNAHFQTSRAVDDGNNTTTVEFASDSTPSDQNGHLKLPTNGNANNQFGPSPQINNVINQEVFWVVSFNPSNFSRAVLERITSFKAVG